MITAEEFYEQERLNGNTEDITGNSNPNYTNRFYSEIFDLMTGFAKLHVSEALKMAYDNHEINTINGYEEDVCELDESSILNAYPLKNIK